MPYYMYVEMTKKLARGSCSFYRNCSIDTNIILTQFDMKHRPKLEYSNIERKMAVKSEVKSEQLHKNEEKLIKHMYKICLSVINIIKMGELGEIPFLHLCAFCFINVAIYMIAVVTKLVTCNTVYYIYP